MSQDKTYNLNIDHKVINKTNYSAGAQLGLPKTSKMQVDVGVGITAGTIRVELNKVRGKARIKGSLQQVDNLVHGTTNQLTRGAGQARTTGQSETSGQSRANGQPRATGIPSTTGHPQTNGQLLEEQNSK